MTIVLGGQRLEVPGARSISYLDDARCAPRLTRVTPRRLPLSIIVVHSLGSRSVQGVTPGAGVPTDPCFPSRYANTGSSGASYDFVIRVDGVVMQMNDPVGSFSWHATNLNPRSLGIEIQQGTGGAIYAVQIEALVRLLDVLTARLGIARQIPWRGDKPDRRVMGRFKSPQSGADYNGLVGHRNADDNRGDPGDGAFVALANAGYERFDLVADQDKATWRERQRELGVPQTGAFDAATRAALATRGNPDGQWVRRAAGAPVDTTAPPAPDDARGGEHGVNDEPDSPLRWLVIAGGALGVLAAFALLGKAALPALATTAATGAVRRGWGARQDRRALGPAATAGLEAPAVHVPTSPELPAWLAGRGPWTVPAGVSPEAQGQAIAALAVAEARDLAVLALARRAMRGARSVREVVRAALALVQALPYVPDPDGVQLLRTAAETVRWGGDCEDLVKLLASMLTALGVRWRMVWMPQRDIDHFTLEADPDGTGAWAWAETTIPTAGLGEDPRAAKQRVTGELAGDACYAAYQAHVAGPAFAAALSAVGFDPSRLPEEHTWVGWQARHCGGRAPTPPDATPPAPGPGALIGEALGRGVAGILALGAAAGAAALIGGALATAGTRR